MSDEVGFGHELQHNQTFDALPIATESVREWLHQEVTQASDAMLNALARQAVAVAVAEAESASWPVT